MTALTSAAKAPLIELKNVNLAIKGKKIMRKEHLIQGKTDLSKVILP